MDGHDREKLSAADLSRQEHLNKYGSFLYCPKRDTLCDHMNGMWSTGCRMARCILDDPEYQRLQERIEENRIKNAQEQHMKREEEKKNPPAPIRDQRNQIKSHVNREMAEIHRLEEASRKAFSNNKPGYGQQLFTRAGIRRQELKKWQEEHEEKEFVNDQQSDCENHR